MIRSFVAIDLPDTAKDALLELGQTIQMPDLYLSQFAEFAGPPN